MEELYYIMRIDDSGEYEEEYFLGFKEGPSHTMEECAMRAVFDNDQALVYRDKDKVGISAGELITRCGIPKEQIKVFKIEGVEVPLEDVLI